MKRTEDDIKRILKGRTALVTGANGFVGSHIAEKLVELGADVHVLVRPSSSGIYHNIAHLQKKVTVHRTDITDKEAIRRVLLNIKKNGSPGPVIFHLAAQAHVGESWERPYETFTANAIGTLNILQTICDLKMKIRKISFAGSSEEYGNVDPYLKKRNLYRFDKGGGLILDECSPLNPQSIYATSKVAGDFLFRDYYRACKVPAVVARKFNNYGPRQNPRFITGTIITQALSNKVVKLGYLGAKRDFTYVKDGAMGHIHVNLFGRPGEVYCFGSGKTIMMKDWLELILKLGREMGYWGEKKIVFEKWRGRLGKSEVEELRVDYSRLHKLSGWETKYSWEEGLKETIEWYAENRQSWIGRVDWR